MNVNVLFAAEAAAAEELGGIKALGLGIHCQRSRFQGLGFRV